VAISCDDLESINHHRNKHYNEINKKLIYLKHTYQLSTYKSQKAICKDLYNKLKEILEQSITRQRDVMAENQAKFSALIKETQNSILKATEDYLIFEVTGLKQRALEIIHFSIPHIEKFVQSKRLRDFKSTLSHVAGQDNVDDILNRIIYICCILLPIKNIYELKKFDQETKSLFFTKDFDPIKKIFLNFKIYAKETFSEPMLEIFKELSKKHQQKAKCPDKSNKNQQNKYNLKKNIAYKNFFKQYIGTDICLLNRLVAQRHAILEKLVFFADPAVDLEEKVLNEFLKLKDSNIEKRLRKLLEKTDLKIRSSL
jgi:hypothetical protein